MTSNYYRQRIEPIRLQLGLDPFVHLEDFADYIVPFLNHLSQDLAIINTRELFKYRFWMHFYNASMDPNVPTLDQVGVQLVDPELDDLWEILLWIAQGFVDNKWDIVMNSITVTSRSGVNMNQDVSYVRARQLIDHFQTACYGSRITRGLVQERVDLYVKSMRDFVNMHYVFGREHSGFDLYNEVHGAEFLPYGHGPPYHNHFGYRSPNFSSFMRDPRGRSLIAEWL